MNIDGVYMNIFIDVDMVDKFNNFFSSNVCFVSNKYVIVISVRKMFRYIF